MAGRGVFFSIFALVVFLPWAVAVVADFCGAFLTGRPGVLGLGEDAGDFLFSGVFFVSGVRAFLPALPGISSCKCSFALNTCEQVPQRTWP